MTYEQLARSLMESMAVSFADGDYRLLTVQSEVYMRITCRGPTRPKHPPKAQLLDLLIEGLGQALLRQDIEALEAQSKTYQRLVSTPDEEVY